MKGRAAYRLLLWAALPVGLFKLWWRGRREPVYRHDIRGRFGWYAGDRPASPLLWVHAVSVGETRAAQPLVEALLDQYPGHSVLVTQMTAAGRLAAQELFGQDRRVHLAWLPYDYPFAVRHFLRQFRPRLGVIMETEIWPHLLEACAEAGVPMLLANARLSSKSAQRYGRAGATVRLALSRFSAIGAQTEADAQRLQAIGAPAERLQVTGNLKFDAAGMGPGVRTPAMRADDRLHAEHEAGSGPAPDLAGDLRRRIGERKVLLAASLRDGEERLILAALAAAGGLAGAALLVLVPRHPQRFDAVGRLIAESGLRYVRRSDAGPVPADCPIMLGDSMGEMAAYYAACDCAFVGGSLLQYGGQNFIEACAAGVPVLIGPHTYNFSQAAEAALAAGAARRVSDAASLVVEANRLLPDDELRRRMGEAGRAFHRAHQGATARTMAVCRRLLPP